MITDEQRKERANYIGSSDIPAIFGLSPWASPADIYYSKVYERAVPAPEGAIDIGNRLEPVILDWGLEQFSEGDFDVKRDPETVRHEDGVNASNPDLLGRHWEKGHLIIEAKTSGIANYNPAVFSEWGHPGSDQVPDSVALQVHHQLAVTGFPVAYVAALLGGRGFLMYKIHAEKFIGEKCLEEARKFWATYVEKKKVPEGSVSMETVKYILRKEGTKTKIPKRLVKRWQSVKRTAMRANQKLDERKAAVIAALGDCEVGSFRGGEVTYYQNKRGFRTLRLGPGAILGKVEED